MHKVRTKVATRLFWISRICWMSHFPLILLRFKVHFIVRRRCPFCFDVDFVNVIGKTSYPSFDFKQRKDRCLLDGSPVTAPVKSIRGNLDLFCAHDRVFGGAHKAMVGVAVAGGSLLQEHCTVLSNYRIHRLSAGARRNSMPRTTQQF
jgi:hypothetical protein